MLKSRAKNAFAGETGLVTDRSLFSGSIPVHMYLYDVAANPELELKADSLLVNHLEEMVLQLGMVKSGNKKEQEYHSLLSIPIIQMQLKEIHRPCVTDMVLRGLTIDRKPLKDHIIRGESSFY